VGVAATEAEVVRSIVPQHVVLRGGAAAAAWEEKRQERPPATANGRWEAAGGAVLYGDELREHGSNSEEYTAPGGLVYREISHRRKSRKGTRDWMIRA
jgi:hypothetical protein